MVNLNRNEIRVILAGLSKERELLREEIKNDPEWSNRLLEAPDYMELIKLQEKFLQLLDRMPY